MTNAEKVKEFTSKRLTKGYECLELETGENHYRIIERYSLSEMKKALKDYICDNEYVGEDEEICITYKDGTFLYVEETKDIKFTNIKGVIFENAETSAYAGKGIEVVDYNDIYEDWGWGGEDWRLEFID